MTDHSPTSHGDRKRLVSVPAGDALPVVPLSHGVGQVETQFFTFGDVDDPFIFSGGERLGPITLAYEIYGELNEARDNAILLFHALTGSQHAAGYNPQVPGVGGLWTEEIHTGWWDRFIGPGRALNTDQFAVICVNYLGGCYGSTGPGSIDPAGGAPYGGSFPRVTVDDIVDSQVRLLDELGIDRLHAVVGGSTGGFMALSVAVRHPERTRYVVPIAAGLRATPLQIIYNFEQVNAILNDPDFRDGDFYGGARPDVGLALARMIGHKTFVSPDALQERARREVRDTADVRIRTALESYMWHQGQKFVARFDANTYLRTMWMWQDFDLYEVARSQETTVSELLAKGEHEYLIFSIDSDICFLPTEQAALVDTLKEADAPVQWITVHSGKGHDTFLLEPDLFTPHLRYHLEPHPPSI